MFQSCIPVGLTGTFGRSRENNPDRNSVDGTNHDSSGNDRENNYDSGSLWWERWIRRGDRGHRKRGDRIVRSVVTLDPSTGALVIPLYKVISRADHCPLLKSAWGQDWEEVLRVCQSHPWRTLHTTQTSGRTALHLSTFDKKCPLAVAKALLQANRHAILVRDSNKYTPLHIVAFFSSSMVSRWCERERNIGLDVDEDVDTEDGAAARETHEEHERRVRACEREAESVVALFCDTAILVEQELRGSAGRCPQTDNSTDDDDDDDDDDDGNGNGNDHCLFYPVPQISPLYLAAKKDAPLCILKRLVETRARTHWIAPCTGGEPYDWQPRGSKRAAKPDSRSTSAPLTNACLSSPLEILLREDRLRHGTDHSLSPSPSSSSSRYGRDRDAYLLEEEEDGNHPPGTEARNQARFTAPTASTRLRIPLRSRSRSSSRAGAGAPSKPQNSRSLRSRCRSPFHPDELEGAPHLVRAMRRLAIDRCHRHYHARTRERCSDRRLDKTPTSARDENGVGQDETEVNSPHPCASRSESLSMPPVTTLTRSQQQCLDLWEKCIELLVTAGGGVPLLEATADQRKNPRQQQQQPYGILHACVCCKVPVPSLVEIALRVFPEQAYQRDLRHGMVPLHHLLRAKHPSHVTSRLLAILLHGTPEEQASRGILQLPPACLSSPSRSSASARASAPRKDAKETVHYRDPSFGSGTKPGPSPEYLRPTVLVPLPPEHKVVNGENNGANHTVTLRTHAGPTPLSYAIRLGLPMDTVIKPLLEADSHTTLRILDPATQLPPFALVATKVPRHETVQGHLIHCNQIGGHQPYSPPTAWLHDDDNSDESQPDLVTSWIESTIHAFSTGDGDGGFRRSTAGNTKKGNGKTKDLTVAKTAAVATETYTVDDVYRILLAHPQVLVQYT